MTDPYKDDPDFADLPPEPFMPGGLIGVDDRPASAARPPVMVPKDKAPGDTSDGYHTFDELYEHRRALTAVLATIGAINGDSWRSRAHHPDDSEIFDGYFIVGINLPDGVITYHYPVAQWDLFEMVPELEHAPKWDGATGQDTVARLDAFTSHLGRAIEMGREVQQAAREAAEKVTEDPSYADRLAVGEDA